MSDVVREDGGASEELLSGLSLTAEPRFVGGGRRPEPPLSQAAEVSRRGPVDGPLLVYLFDPYCPWSYGYLPAVSHLLDMVAGEVAVEVIPSGPHAGVPIHDVATPMGAVHQATGADFGPGYRMALSEGTLVLDSRRSSAAVAALLAAAPGRAGEVLLAAQRAFFWDGKSLADAATLADVATGLGLDADGVVAFAFSDVALELADEDSLFARELGFTDRPALLLALGGDFVELEGPGTTGERLVEQLRGALRA